MRAQSQRPYGRLFPGRRRPLTTGFDPRSLFRNGEQGFWYDPSDLSTLFQDETGTIPVTGVGQPVALMLDKSGRGHPQSISVPASRSILRRNAATGAYYLETDGADDYMVSAPIDLTGTDEISLFAGARKISDAAVGMLFELSVASSNNGSFFMIGSSPTNVFQGRIAGSLQSTLNSAPYPAPYSAVLRLVGDISGDRTDVGVNGVVVQSSADLGLGNFGLHSLYLFRRGGTTLPWAGHFYGLIGVGRLMTATETRNAERWMARKVGAALA